MKLSCKWIHWAHGPGSEDGQELATQLVELAKKASGSTIEVDDPQLIAEVVSVAELYARPARGDSLFDMGPWWRSQPAKVITEGRAELRKVTVHAAG